MDLRLGEPQLQEQLMQAQPWWIHQSDLLGLPPDRGPIERETAGGGIKSEWRKDKKKNKSR